jgi:hypothetical protein
LNSSEHRVDAVVQALPEPIILKDGQELHTLNDAAAYIAELSKSEQDSAETRIASEALSLAAETDAPTLLALTAVLSAIRRHRPEAAPARPMAKILRILGRNLNL